MKTIISLVFIFLTLRALYGEEFQKPRIIIMTDLGADPDDEQSMERFFVQSNEFDVEGLILTTGCWGKNQSTTKMPDDLLDAYGKVVPNNNL